MMIGCGLERSRCTVAVDFHPRKAVFDAFHVKVRRFDLAGEQCGL